jgi:hypothetical protein
MSNDKTPLAPPDDSARPWPSLLRDKRAADYCDVSESTFLTLAALKGLKPVDIPLRVKRWRRSDLDALIDGLPLRGPDEPRAALLVDDSADEGLRRVQALGGKRSRPKR